MAILPAVTNLFQGVGITEQQFKLVSRQEFSRTASGVTIGRDLGPALWQASYTLAPIRHEDVLRVEAKLHSLNGVTRGFYAGDIRGRMPHAYPDGAFNDTGVIASFTGSTMNLSGLPAGFIITAGDYMEYDYGVGNQLRALLQVVNDVTATGGGVAEGVEFRPFIPTGTPIGGAVRFKNPRALFTLNTDGYEQTVIDSLFTQLSFSATQSFLR